MIFVNHTQNLFQYYLYQYIRLDKNEVFYVGVGKRYKGKTDFRRARANHKHNSICMAIIAKTNYQIEIIEESDDYNSIREREKELIATYGRKHNNTGILANMTAGGDGFNDIDKSHLFKKCYAYTKYGKFVKEFDSIQSAAAYFDVSSSNISSHIHGNFEWLVKGHQFRFEKVTLLAPVLTHNEKITVRLGKRIVQRSLEGEFIREWMTSHSIHKELGYSRGAICDCCRGKRTKAYGFHWEFILD